MSEIYGTFSTAYVEAMRLRLSALEPENKDLRARVAELEARCKRMEEAGDVLQSAVVGVEGMTHWQWLAAAHEADLKWLSAKEAKP